MAAVNGPVCIPGRSFVDIIVPRGYKVSAKMDAICRIKESGEWESV